MKALNILSLILISLFIGCSGSKGSGGEEVLAKYIKEQPVTGSGSIFFYEYSIGGSEPKELKVYVKDRREYVEITAGASEPSIKNKFLYYPNKTPPNFFYELRDIKENAYSLREAVDKSVLYYLENF